MFERPWHRDVLRILGALDAERLAETSFLFAGGTRLVLELGEFRESLDIDFLCSDPAGYGAPKEAWAKAEGAYGSVVRADLHKALALFTEDLEFQQRCFEGLRIHDRPRILRGITLLAEDLDA